MPLLRTPGLPLALFCLVCLVFAAARAEAATVYPDPTRFQAAIDAFTEEDGRAAPPPGALVATGSSSIRYWRDRLAADLAPLTVIPRGFGGSNLNDMLYYLDELVLRYRPRALLLYGGDNDLALGASPELILDTLDELVNLAHERNRELRIYVMSVKPSPARGSLWPLMRETNRRLAAFCETDERLTYIDVATSMLKADGTPDESLFIADLLHLNAAGYDGWRDAVRPVLLRREAGFE